MDKCKVIAIADQKGGIDKTTEALYIATVLENRKYHFRVNSACRIQLY